jgi:hypothetical protein
MNYAQQILVKSLDTDFSRQIPTDTKLAKAIAQGKTTKCVVSQVTKNGGNGSRSAFAKRLIAFVHGIS